LGVLVGRVRSQEPREQLPGLSRHIGPDPSLQSLPCLVSSLILAIRTNGCDFCHYVAARSAAGRVRSCCRLGTALPSHNDLGRDIIDDGFSRINSLYQNGPASISLSIYVYHHDEFDVRYCTVSILIAYRTSVRTCPRVPFFLYLRWCQTLSASDRRVAGSDANIDDFTLDVPLLVPPPPPPPPSPPSSSSS
jgi:hypothetical protein